MPRLTREQILSRLRGTQSEEEKELEEQAAKLEQPIYTPQEKNIAGALGTALGSIGASTYRGLGKDDRAKEFEQEMVQAGGLFAKKDKEREALREKLKEKINAKRKERLEEGLTASKEDRALRGEDRSDLKLGISLNKEDRAAQEFDEQRAPLPEATSGTLQQKIKELGIEEDVSKLSRMDLDDFLKTLPASKKQKVATSFSMAPTQTLIESHIAQQKRAGNPAFRDIDTPAQYVNKTIQETGRAPVMADIIKESSIYSKATGTQEQLLKKGTMTHAGAQSKIEEASKARDRLKKLVDLAGDEYLGVLDAPIASAGTTMFGSDAFYRNEDEKQKASALRDLRAKTNVSNITEFVREFLGSQVTDNERQSLKGFLMDVNRAASTEDMKASIDNLFDHVKQLQEKKMREGTLMMGGSPQQEPQTDEATRLQKLRRLKELREKAKGG